VRAKQNTQGGNEMIEATITEAMVIAIGMVTLAAFMNKSARGVTYVIRSSGQHTSTRYEPVGG
jgi:hypothetical protein